MYFLRNIKASSLRIDIRQCNLQVHIYRTFDTMLEDIWRSLEEDCNHFVFQSYEWLAHWQRTVGQHSYGIEPTVVVVSDLRRPLALFPLGMRRIGGVKVLEFLGGAQSDYNSPLILPEVSTADQFRVLWDKVLNELPAHDVRYFVRMPQQCGGSRNHFLDIASSFCEGSAYAATLPVSWDEFRHKLPSKFQKDNARMIRRLSEMGRFKFVVAKTAFEFNNIIDAMFVQKERRYKETGARNILADTSTRTFYRELGECVGGDVKIHLSALMLNEEILATHLGAVHQERFYYLFPTYAGEAWAKFSPGRLLLENLVQWAIDNRLRTFDFTIGGEAYKEIWCDSEMTLYRVVEPLTVRGQIFAWSQELVYWIRTNQRVRTLAMSVLRMLTALRRN
jgi:CelD/BcsL family acetyltransferase involved in cellulose biosynthesis